MPGEDGNDLAQALEVNPLFFVGIALELAVASRRRVTAYRLGDAIGDMGCGVLQRTDVPFGWLLPDASAPAPVSVTHRVVARSMQFEFVQDYRGGETIHRAGTPIAHDAGEPVRTPYDDCVLVMPSVRQLRPGVTTVRLGRRASAA